jgi:hypothetical protein
MNIGVVPLSSIPGIRFNDCFFTEPANLDNWCPPKFTGLFVILAHDPHWAPRPYQPLCFGEFGNNAISPIEQSGCAWWMAPPDRKSLYISVLPLPFSTSAQRGALRNELISAYNPVLQANPLHAPSADLAQRLEEMEKRQREHAAQVLLLLGSIHRQFEPQPVPVRRRIGFLPDDATPASNLESPERREATGN